MNLAVRNLFYIPYLATSDYVSYVNVSLLIFVFIAVFHTGFVISDFFSGRGFAARMARVPRSSLHFSVDVSAARPWEHVFVTGSTPSLGLWDPSKAVQLSPDPQNKSVFNIGFITH
uniref:CBM20 domain-containing protein n=1 Tax=Parascaris equorum TaxID=6256 RepID=A0A914RRJ8_PAREQ